MDDVWTIASWLRSLGLHRAIAKALEPERKSVSDHYAFVSQSLSDDDLRKRLTAAGLSGLVQPIATGLASLRRQKAATGAALSSKFKADGDAYKGEMGFASIEVFFSGLEGLVGPPLMLEGSLLKQMECEHTREADSNQPFNTSNGIFGATSLEEWEFVVNPNPNGTSYVERSDGFDSEHPEWRRANHAQPLAFYAVRMDAQNARLKSKGHTAMTVEELVGGRLYTGPMFEKFNGVLRCFSAPLERSKDSREPFLQERARMLGLGKWYISADSRAAWQWHNKYATTLHAVNSCVLKLSKLTALCTVYRGFTDAVLPASFFRPNEDGVCGGVEYGFTSTSAVRAHAQHYATGKASTLFTNRMGMVDRGADFSWLSQYPHEKEILFPPLVGLEVIGTKVQGSTLVVESRFSLNMAAQTLEQVVSKRRKMLLDMATGLHFEVRNTLIAESNDKEWTEEQADLRGQFASAVVRDGLATARTVDWLNEDANFSDAVKWAMEAKKKLSKATVEDLELSHLGWLRHLPDRTLDLLEIQTLNLKYCSELRALPERLGVLKRLTSLNLYGCKTLAMLPESISQCTLLQEVDCQACTALSTLPDGLGTLSKLESLNLYGCRLLSHLPESLNWPALSSLNLGACIRLKALPAALGRCNDLHELNLASCTALADLPDLSSLGIKVELKLTGLPPTLSEWQSGGLRAHQVVARAEPGAASGSESKRKSVIVSTFTNLFSSSSSNKRGVGVTGDADSLSVGEMREEMAMRIQRAARAKMRRQLFKELIRLSANEWKSGGGSERKSGPVAGAYLRKGASSHDQAKASAIKAKLAERKLARASTGKNAPPSPRLESAEEIAQQEAVARALLQA